MQFVAVPEPHVSCGHSLARTPLLYRLDARNEQASVVVHEYDRHTPFIEANGSNDESCILLRKALGSLENFWVSLDWDPRFPPIFTLDLRPAHRRQALLTGFDDTRIGVVSYGDYRYGHLAADVSAVHERVLDLAKRYYHDW